MEMKGKCFSACNRGQRRKSDLYVTPYSITEQLFEVEKFDKSKIVLEPACGKFAIVHVLEKYFNNGNIRYFDIDKESMRWIDFLSIEIELWNNINYIITNPPFSLAGKFIEKAKQLYQEKICFLLPLSYLHGQKRYKQKIFSELKCVYVFTRYPLLTDTIRPDGKYKTGMIVYAWYVWEKGWNKEPVIRWIDNQKYILKTGEI